MGTSLESFRKLRSLSPDDPEWKRLRDQIFEENIKLVYTAVNKEGWPLLNTLTGGTYDLMWDDLVQLASIELSRVIPLYDPDRLNPYNPGQPIQFATYALSNMLLKVRTQCQKELSHNHNFEQPAATDDEGEGESLLDDIVAPPTSEELRRVWEEEKDHIFSQCDPALVVRLRGILDKLWGGDAVSIFERHLLFRLIADPGLILTRVERAGARLFAAAEVYEPLPLRRYRWWRQVLN